MVTDKQFDLWEKFDDDPASPIWTCRQVSNSEYVMSFLENGIQRKFIWGARQM